MQHRLFSKMLPKLKIWHGSTENFADESYHQAFSLWHSLWKTTFEQLDGVSTLYSDDFSRQDRILALFLGETCVAVAGHKEFDLRRELSQCDSYFRPWRPQDREVLASFGPQIFSLNYLAVHPDFRGPQAEGLVFKSLLITLSVYFLLESNLHAMSGVPRNNKGINDVAYENSAQNIARNLNYHNVPVDLVAFFRTQINQSLPSLANLSAKQIWQNRIDAQNKAHVISIFQPPFKQSEAA